MMIDDDDDWNYDTISRDQKCNVAPPSVTSKPERKIYVNERKNDTYRNFQSNRNYNKKAFKTIQIPSKCVGMIIGKKGVTITSLQLTSDTRIEITKETETDRNNPSETTTKIKIHGDNDNDIKTAEDLIWEKVSGGNRGPKQWNSSALSTEPTETTQNQNSELVSGNTYQSSPASNQAPTTSAFSDIPEGKTLAEMYDDNDRIYWSKFPEVIKDFYQELPEVSQMTKEEVKQFRMQQNNIMIERISFTNTGLYNNSGEKRYTVEDDNLVPNPVKTFYQAFHNYPEVLQEIRKAGFTTPSPIQCQAWPILLSGHDLIGIAQTGTGKTLAFLLPALIHIDGQKLKRPERQGPAVLIFAPTRELALQIDKEVKKYTYRGIKSLCVYGGGDRKAQIEQINNGVDIVIATPGRLNDIYSCANLNIESITYVVLDEADRMLDMGFEPQIRKIMYGLRPSRQCIMTSATFPNDVIRLATSYTLNPIKVTVGSLDLVATHSVTQVIHIVDEDDKQKMFLDFITENFHENSPFNALKDKKIIVFCRTKSGADNLAAECALNDIACSSLHGAKDQMDREKTFVDITVGNINVLIATDLASRGLDISDLTHVLNYDFPKNIEEYVHRVGRTGRAGKRGESITYFTRGDWMHAETLIKILQEADQEVPNELFNMAERYKINQKRRQEEAASGGGGGRGRSRGHGGFRGGNRNGFSSRW